MATDQMLTTTQVAVLLGLSRDRVLQLANAGTTRAAQRTPLGRLYPRHEVDALAERRAAERATRSHG